MITRTVKNRYGRFSFMSNDEFIGACLNEGRPWEEMIVEYTRGLLSSDDLVIDIGAHIGTFSIPVSLFCGQVHSFEVQRPMYKLLLYNIYDNDRYNIVPRYTAIGAHEGFATVKSELLDGTNKVLSYNTDVPTNYGGVSVSIGTSGDVMMKTVDSLHLNPRLIKIDVEGLEDDVVHGSSETINKYRPIILYERNWKYVPSSTVKNLESLEEYDTPYEIVKNSDYILYPLYPIDLPQLMSDSLGSRVIVINRFVTVGTRGPFKIFTPSEGRIRVHFTDIGLIADGSIDNQKILWSNGTVWQ